MLTPLLVFGAIVHITSSISYTWSTLKGRTRPNRMTFFMWALAPFIGSAAALVSGVGWAVLPVFLSGFFPLLHFCASFVNPNAYWKLGPFDYVCGTLSALALVLWAMTGEPVVAIFFAVASDACAGIPTVIKAWRHPETEHFGAYAGSIFNLLISFTVMTAYTFSAVAFPIYLIGMDSIILLGIYRNKIFR